MRILHEDKKVKIMYNILKLSFQNIIIIDYTDKITNKWRFRSFRMNTLKIDKQLKRCIKNIERELNGNKSKNSNF